MLGSDAGGRTSDGAEYCDFEHSLLKNKLGRGVSDYNTTNGTLKRKIEQPKTNILNSLTKQEIDDPFISNKITNSGMRSNTNLNNFSSSMGY